MAVFGPLVLAVAIFCVVGWASTTAVTQTGAKQSSPADVASTIARELRTLSWRASGFARFREVYSSLLSNGAASVEKLDGKMLVEEFSKDLQRKLDSKTDALESIKKETKKLYENHTHDADIQSFQFFNSKDLALAGFPITKKLVKFAPDQLVNLSMSSMQIPTNVYDKSKTILNAAKWIQKMDLLYRSNFKTHPSLLWQYFCIPEGIFDIYPGYPWPNLTADRYDCRRRSWYIQGMSSQKDMVLIIDTSGSMTGKNIAIATVAAHQIIASLQENDFFNVILYNTNARVLLRGTQALVQASRENKERAYLELDRLPKPNGPVDVAIGLETAFRLLQVARSSEFSTSGCHQIISVLTDGIENNDTVKEIYERRSKQDHTDKVRIFTYQLGLYRPLPSNLLKWLSCRSKGKYYSIVTAGDIWDKILDYVTVLGKPMAMHGDEVGPFYVPIYLDFGGAGMVTSLVAPVFSSKEGPKVLAVVGQDISVSELYSTTPVHAVGVNGFGFSINNNGFVLFHPSLKGQLGHLQDPPTVLLPHIIHAQLNESAKLMVHMIQRRTGQMTFESAVLLPRFDEKRMHTINITYYFAPANNTPFSCAIALPTYSASKLKWHHQDNLEAALHMLLDNSTSFTRLMATWKYCNFSVQFPEVDSLELIRRNSDIHTILDAMAFEPRLPPQCDTALMRDYLISLHATESVLGLAWDADFNSRSGVLLVFVSNSAGYSAFMSTEKEPRSQAMGRKATGEVFYERAVEALGKDEGHFIYDVQDASIVEASSPIVVGDEATIAAVTGYAMNQSVVEAILRDAASSQGGPGDSNDATVGVVSFYLLDESGFIVASILDDGSATQVGAFFGAVDGMVSRDMLAKGALTRHHYADRQGDCPQQDTQGSGSSRTTNTVFAAVVGAASFLMTVAQSLLSVLGGIVVTQGSPAVGAASPHNISCTKQMSFFRFNESAVPFQGSVRLGPCEKNFSIHGIPLSNLFLVSTTVASADQEACKAHHWQLSREPVKIQFDESAQLPFFRVPLPECVRFHPDEVSRDCPGNGLVLTPAATSLAAGIVCSGLAHWGLAVAR